MPSPPPPLCNDRSPPDGASSGPTWSGSPLGSTNVGEPAPVLAVHALQNADYPCVRTTFEDQDALRIQAPEGPGQRGRHNSGRTGRCQLAGSRASSTSFRYRPPSSTGSTAATRCAKLSAASSVFWPKMSGRSSRSPSDQSPAYRGTTKTLNSWPRREDPAIERRFERSGGQALSTVELLIAKSRHVREIRCINVLGKKPSQPARKISAQRAGIVPEPGVILFQKDETTNERRQDRRRCADVARGVSGHHR